MTYPRRSLNIFGHHLEFFVVLAIVISPFTQLRFAFFGLAEIIVLLLFFQVVSKPIPTKILRKCIFSQFWLVYISISFLGSLYNVFVLGHVTSTMVGTFFDFAAYILVLFACFGLEINLLQGNLKPSEILKKVFFCSSIFLTILYIIGFFTKSLFGFQIMLYHLFVPLAENLHQVSMFTVTLPFVGMYAFSKSKGAKIKSLIILLIILDIQMAFNMGSSKAVFAIIVGLASVLLGRFLLAGGRRYLPLLLLIFVWCVVFVIQSFDLVSVLVGIFKDADGGGARAFLYSTGVSIAMMSPVIGLGAGQHIPNGLDFFSDSHQTHLTIFLQSGLLGLSVYLIVMFRVFTKVLLVPSLLAAFMAITLYSAGGDILRRLPIWFMILLVFYASIENEKLRKLMPRAT